MSSLPQSPSLPQSHSVFPALHITNHPQWSSFVYAQFTTSLNLYIIIFGRPSCLVATTPSQQSYRDHPLFFLHHKPLSGFHETNYKCSTFLPQQDSFSFSGHSRPSASFTYSGRGSRARPDGAPGHQSTYSTIEFRSTEPILTAILYRPAGCQM